MDFLEIRERRYIESYLQDYKIFNRNYLIYSRDMVDFETTPDELNLTLKGKVIYSVDLIRTKPVKKLFKKWNIHLHFKSFPTYIPENTEIFFTQLKDFKGESFYKRLAEHLLIRFEKEYINGLISLNNISDMADFDMRVNYKE